MDQQSSTKAEPEVQIDVPFAIHALSRLPMRKRGRVMMSVMQAAQSERPTEAEKALVTLFVGGARRGTVQP